MSSVGQAVGGVVGAVAGFFIGGPSGALYGAQIGMGVGGLLDPPKGPHMEGPRLSDLSVQTSTYGAVIPRVYGTVALYGNVFWLENNALKEVARTESQGGKGGPTSTTTTYSYFATFAVGLCEGPIVGVRRIWVGSKLIYDAGGSDYATIAASNAVSGLFTLHQGSDTQLPDDRMQATLGVANTPAYRGLAYLVLKDYPLADHGNSLAGAPIKVEVVVAGSSSISVTTVTVASQDPDYFIASNGQIVVSLGYNAAAGIGHLSNDGGASFVNIQMPAFSWNRIIWGKDKFIATGNSGGVTKTAYSFDGVAWFMGADLPFPSRSAIVWTGSIFVATGMSVTSTFTSFDGISWLTYSSAIALYQWLGLAWSGTTVCTVAFNGTVCSTSNDGALWATISMPPSVPGWQDVAYGNGIFMALGQTGQIATSIDDGVTWNLQTNSSTGGSNSSLAFGDGIWVVANGVRSKYSRDDGNTWTALSTVMGVVRYNGAWFNFAYTSRVGNVKFDLLASGTTSLSSIVQAELLASNLLDVGDINTSALTQTVRGYRVASVAAIRSALEPLQGAWPFDAVQSGYQIVFRLRGGSSVATIPAIDLDARGAGEKSGVSITNTREMDSVLPARVSIKYLDASREYDTGEQYAERLNTDAVNIRSIDMAIVMIGGESAATAEMLLYLYWLERYDLTFRLPPTYNQLEPADVITINATEAVYSLRLTAITYTQDGRLECTAKYNSAAIYAPAALGEEGQSTGGTLTLAGATRYELLDIPLLLDATDLPGFPVAMTGYLAGWPGGVLYRTDDEGQTWTDLQGFSAPGAVIGYASNSVGAGRTDLIDKASALAVVLTSGTLSSVTELAMLGGANHFAYGIDGRWEIIAAQNCTLQGDGSYVLTDLLRGRQGSEWACGLHVAGDKIVLLDSTRLAFVGSSLNSIGLLRTYRGITSGKALDSAADNDFAYTGVNLECLSPCYLNGNRHPTSNDWSLDWLRRTRVGGAWRDYVDATLGETTQSYEIDIFSSAAYTTVKRTLTGLSTPTAAYTSAQQVTDFGSNQATIYVKVYQLSANVGRGYPLTTSITR